MLKPPASGRCFIERPPDQQKLLPWTDEDHARLNLPAAAPKPPRKKPRDPGRDSSLDDIDRMTRDGPDELFA